MSVRSLTRPAGQPEGHWQAPLRPCRPSMVHRLSQPQSLSPLPRPASTFGVAAIHAGCMIRLAILVTSFLGMNLATNMIRLVVRPATSVVLPLASAL